ncbi:hypothetical protein M5689_020602 [Euphorbia peplus]|nr:hypothetical protein M5689_020602 [Euphorbia peplus]
MLGRNSDDNVARGCDKSTKRCKDSRNNFPGSRPRGPGSRPLVKAGICIPSLCLRNSDSRPLVVAEVCSSLDLLVSKLGFAPNHSELPRIKS